MSGFQSHNSPLSGLDRVVLVGSGAESNSSKRITVNWKWETCFAVKNPGLVVLVQIGRFCCQGSVLITFCSPEGSEGSKGSQFCHLNWSLSDIKEKSQNVPESF